MKLICIWLIVLAIFYLIGVGIIKLVDVFRPLVIGG